MSASAVLFNRCQYDFFKKSFGYRLSVKEVAVVFHQLIDATRNLGTPRPLLTAADG